MCGSWTQVRSQSSHGVVTHQLGKPCCGWFSLADRPVRVELALVADLVAAAGPADARVQRRGARRQQRRVVRRPFRDGHRRRLDERRAEHRRRAHQRTAQTVAWTPWNKQRNKQNCYSGHGSLQTPTPLCTCEKLWFSVVFFWFWHYTITTSTTTNTWTTSIATTSILLLLVYHY